MAKLILKSSEYTVETLVARMKSSFGKKNNGALFSKADIHDWANKQRIPKQYGGEYIRVSKLGPLKILTLSAESLEDFTQQKVVVEYEQ